MPNTHFIRDHCYIHLYFSPTNINGSRLKKIQGVHLKTGIHQRHNKKNVIVTKKIYISSTNYLIETFYQTSKVQVKNDKIAKYSTINPLLHNKFNPCLSQ